MSRTPPRTLELYRAAKTTVTRSALFTTTPALSEVVGVWQTPHMWVLLWGHRRLAAAGQAFADDPGVRVPVIIRNDDVCDNAQKQLELMTRNALAHRSWNPIEEARAFQASVNAGRTQVEIAEMCGCHQSHVSGRLALLRLPEEIAEAVASGQLRVADARKVARLDDHEQMCAVWHMYLDRREDAWITSIDQAITEHAGRVAYQARRQAALNAAEAQGLRVVDPVEEFGRDLEVHRLDSPHLVEAARSAGALVAGISGFGDLDYFTTSPGNQQRRGAGRPGPGTASGCRSRKRTRWQAVGGRAAQDTYHLGAHDRRVPALGPGQVAADRTPVAAVVADRPAGRGRPGPLVGLH